MNRSLVIACFLTVLAQLSLISPVKAQRSMGPRGYLRVVLKDAVQKDLGINENAELKTKLDALVPEFKKENDAAFQKTREERLPISGKSGPMYEVEQKYNEKVVALLNAEQIVRVRQYLWQEMGWRRFSDVEFSQKLELNQEQNASIQTAEKQWMDEYQERLQQLRLKNITAEQFRDQMRTSSTEITEKLEGFLTDKQREQLPILLGKSFELEDAAK